MIVLDQVRRLVRRAAVPYIGCLSNADLDRRLAHLESEIAAAREDLGDTQAILDELYTGPSAAIHIMDGSGDA